MDIWKNSSQKMKPAVSIILKLRVIEKPPRKAMKDHISVTKGSITSKNFEIFLKNLTHS